MCYLTPLIAESDCSKNLRLFLCIRHLEIQQALVLPCCSCSDLLAVHSRFSVSTFLFLFIVVVLSAIYPSSVSLRQMHALLSYSATLILGPEEDASTTILSESHLP